ncbi:MAG: DUF47 family protein [Anaerolineales bacterium]|jgi:hypothetical protein|nr:DUF47 family protein [Anaerolineales bacterium]MDP7545075.1 DUF47 family protein [Anaerolineales bacterium]MDP7644074.1 DUF47 family protein [Anaerolineales bacterium]HJL69369.1 DUF47 family protein [Anaerolineales bacterium]HJN40789.1 DUF47 family protein [Anaerolineales bacterium]
MGFFKRSKKKQRDSMVELLIRQAEFTHQGLQLLQSYTRDPQPETAQQLRSVEKDADEVRRMLIDELNRNFITPLDREDIFALSRAVDDVVDYADTTLDEMVLLGIEPTPFLERMASLLTDAAAEIHKGVLRLQDRPSVANEHAMRAKALENRVERIYREAIADLFSRPRDLDHVVEMLKLREIYRHLSNAADRGDEAANVIADIVVKKV